MREVKRAVAYRYQRRFGGVISEIRTSKRGVMALLENNGKPVLVFAPFWKKEKV